MENGDQDSASRLEQARIAAGFEKSARQAALHFGWAPSTYGAHENGQNRLKREPAEKYAAAFGVRAEWLLTGEEPREAPRSASILSFRQPRPKGGALPGMIPIFGMAAAGDPDRLIMMNEVVDTVERPPQLNGVEGGYALFVHGSSMENRYYPGELLYVHPYKPVVPDSFCVVQFGSDPNNPEGAFVKQFKSRDASRVVLKQFNPEKEITLPAKNVISIHRIVGGGEF